MSAANIGRGPTAGWQARGPRAWRIVAVALSVILGAAVGCGRSEEAKGAPDAAESPRVPGAAGAAHGGAPAAQAHPTTEEGLVEAVARAIEARDIDGLAALSTPEQAADLRTLQERDPDGFWRRGHRWVENVKSGFTVAQRTDPKAPRWRALVRFGNGAEETVVFTRTGGKLYFEQL